MLKKLRGLFKPSPYKIAIGIGFAFFVFHFSTKDHLDRVAVVGRLENIFHDLKIRERGTRKPSGDVVVAAVDEKAISKIGLWPFKRGDTATLVDKISALGAKAIVFDVAYIDETSEGQFAAAQRLQRRFEQLSLANPEASEMLSRIQEARTGANAALSAVNAIAAAENVKDVKVRLDPVAQSLDEAWQLLQKYRTLNADYAADIAKEAGGASGDVALGEAVHRSNAVVLGSFLLTPAEAKDIPPAKLAADLASLPHIRIQLPTREPQIGPEAELVTESAPQRGVSLLNFAGAHSAIEPLIKPGPNGVRPQLAFFNTNPDKDGVIRREPLVVSVAPSAGEEPILMPQIDLGGAMKFYDADPAQTRLWVNADATQLETVAILPNSAKGIEGFPKLKDFKQIPVDSNGQLLLNYYGPDKTFTNISLGDIWDGTAQRNQIEGKVVLFGVTATATFDQRVTPFNPISPGVEIHATAIENILHNDFLRRPWWATPLESALILFIALFVGLFLTRISVVRGAFVTILIAVVYHFFDYTLFTHGMAIFSAVPIAEVMMIYVSQTIYRYVVEEAGKRQIRNAFQLYLQPSVIDQMLKQPELPKLGGEKKNLTVMFSDIRGFTTISEKLTPEQLAKLINEYLTPMTSLVFEHGGTLDKYIGDALMAIYGAPVDQPDHALRCCRTAVHMMRELAKLQERWRMEGNNYPPIDIGIGINSGPMVVGNMGGNQRFDYTVLGDNVNLASRLEGTNKEYRSHIIISEATFVGCEGQVAARELGAVRVKGKKEPVKIFELLDDKPAEGEIAKVIETFNAGIAKFRQQQWEEARQQFRKVLEIWPHDGPPQAYIDFCNDMEKEPPGPDWDGVYTMTHK